MKVLVVGSGGREHAIAWKISQNSNVETVYCAPGNGATHMENKCVNVNINTIEELKNFALKENIALTVVGPEEPLTKGITDVFKAEGLKIFGPSQEAAKLEGSKIFAKNFMKKYGVKTAEYEVFTDYESASKYVKTCRYPVVIKADGLAAGKGVVICKNEDEAIKVLEDFMLKDAFNGSGKRVVMEEYLEGVEASILTITDGEVIIPFISAKDHKQIFDKNLGPNTGGMGVISPNPYCSEEVLESFKKDIMLPTLKGIQEEKLDYIGIIFFGIMITKNGVYNLEYNVRMGDPETQAVLPLMESDLLDLINSAINKDLKNYNIQWKKAHSCCVVAASEGYPGSYEKGFPIEINPLYESKVFGAGVAEKDSKLYTSGGRVLAVTSIGDGLEEAIEKAYRDIKNVNFKGIYYRKDIGTLY
ncbi:MAG: phosphoribosylamine--glycine ligase [Clostridiales bacterium]|uniref:phosphoribosylamine--glycine ligase n=1 Tax=Clostridium sp. N3C TaxID=1776758 RepID=UPI00092DF82C|nr:phosphoribosylamine--glycine ligase [Clostridium sp. N3C]NLZ47820.1 phosphoribosylamine--glycine ligase [Clostridiales bacterium]SCN22341.1 Phosphoribosylamine-glycine ligase [Clostridium sp. N3C]